MRKIIYSCDICNAECADVLNLTTTNTDGTYKSLPDLTNLDICPSCMDKITKKVLQIIKGYKGISAKPVKEDKFDTGKMCALHNAGWSQEKIADEMGVSQGYISKRLKALQ